MKKAKWIPRIEYTSRETLASFEEVDAEDCDKYNEVEIAVVREDNKLGLESAGWDSGSKITLFSCDTGLDVGDDEEADKLMNWWRDVANTIANALNEKEL